MKGAQVRQKLLPELFRTLTGQLSWVKQVLVKGLFKRYGRFPTIHLSKLQYHNTSRRVAEVYNRSIIQAIIALTVVKFRTHCDGRSQLKTAEPCMTGLELNRM